MLGGSMLGVAQAMAQVYAAMPPEQRKAHSDSVKAAKWKDLTFDQGCKVVIGLFVLHAKSLDTINAITVGDMCEAELATEYAQGITYAISNLKELNPTGKW